VLGGILFGIFSILKQSATTTTTTLAVPPVTATTASQAVAVAPPLPTAVVKPVVGVPRAITTNAMLEWHYDAPTVRQEGSTRRMREVHAIPDDDDAPWWASAGAPPPVRPPTAHANDSIGIDMVEHCYVSPNHHFIDPSPPAAQVADHEPLWYDEVELSPS
jgi:hypothetical protein